MFKEKFYFKDKTTLEVKVNERLHISVFNGVVNVQEFEGKPRFIINLNQVLFVEVKHEATKK